MVLLWVTLFVVKAFLQSNMPVVRIADNKELFDYIDRLKKDYPAFKVIGTTAHKEKNIFEEDLSPPLMLMLGNETMGLNKVFKEYCDTMCTIPMDVDSYASSFNVSCAASILLYEVNRQRLMNGM